MRSLHAAADFNEIFAEVVVAAIRLKIGGSNCLIAPTA
jgi:hypothetical protein